MGQENREDDENGIVFGRDGDAGEESGREVMAPSSLLQNARAKIQRYRKEKGHGDVEHDLMAVEDVNEGGGQEKRGGKARLFGNKDLSDLEDEDEPIGRDVKWRGTTNGSHFQRTNGETKSLGTR